MRPPDFCGSPEGRLGPIDLLDLWVTTEGGCRGAEPALKDLRKGDGDERLLEKIARMVPGYGGYKNKELRREADKRQRAYLTRMLSEDKSRLESVNAKMAERMRLDALGVSDRLARKLEKIIDRMKFASYGYAGFFDIAKVREEELKRVYELDASLLDDVQAVGKKISELERMEGPQEEMTRVLRQVDALVEEFDRKLNDRENILKGMI